MSVFNDVSSELHTWDNAAFDCVDASVRNSWSNVNDAFRYSDKENHNINIELEFVQVDEQLQIENEIEDVEKGIDRLLCRLLELKREKIERSEKRGKVGFLEQEKKQIISCGATTRKMIREMNASSTPLNKKSCFWKMDRIDELKMTKERGRKRLSLSPRADKATLKLPKQAATTVESKKTTRMDEKVMSSVLQPKKLFNEAVKKMGNKAESKNNAGLMKRLLPENYKSKGNENKRVSLEVVKLSSKVEEEMGNSI